jgi:2-dehydropantoate 2-reductase
MRAMRMAVVGLGAVGGLLAARLAAGGHDVSGLARGATLAAVRTHGLQLEEDGRRSVHALRVSDRAEALGPQELVIVAVKAPALAAVAPLIVPLLGPDTPVLTAMNGLPWWFLRAVPGTLPDGLTPRLALADPDGCLERTLPLPRLLGGVVHLTCSAPAPGLVRHGFGQRLIVGEPAGGFSQRAETVVAALRQGGFEVEASDDIRSAIWFKLWGNMTTNPVSALTGATTDRLFDDPLVTAFCLRAMAEAAAIGARIGCPIGQSGEARIAVGRQLGAFKTSMLQDVEAGRPLELDALVGTVHEIGRGLGIATPNIDALLGLTRLMAGTRGLL